MFTTVSRSLRFLPVLLAVAVLACSEDSPAGPGGGTPSALIGTWNATAFNALGQDLVAQGMGLTFTFDAQGAYSINITNDQANLCDVGPNCSVSGTYSATGSQITLDPIVDPVVLSYSIQGTTMTVSGTVDGIPITATFAKQ